ncbi:unnamed protein product, partial [Prorocentrum cordatum]
ESVDLGRMADWRLPAGEVSAAGSGGNPGEGSGGGKGGLGGERAAKQLKTKGGERGAGSRQGRGDEQIDLVEAVITLQKMGLRQDQRSRELEHMLCQFFLLGKMNPVSQAGLQAGLKYNKEDGAKEVLGKYKVLINSGAGRAALTELFGCFRVKEAYSEDGTDEKNIKVKITYQVNPAADLEKVAMTTKFVMDTMPSPQTFRRAMHATFLEQGGVEAEGPAPKDELTRVTERQLKALQQ